jgi:hypothetical protein
MTTTDLEIENALKELSASRKRISVAVGTNLYEKLTRHLFLLKATNKRYSQNDWICEAIKEGLEIEKIDVDLPKERKINLCMDDNTFKRLEERVQFFKQIYYSFSKKQWIVEAIYKKLDRDAGKLKEELQRLHTLKK